MDKKKLNNTYITKSQLKFIIATDIFIFFTIAMIIFEMKKNQFKFSYVMLGFIFILMSINQYIYYKNNKTKRFLIMTCIYSIIGLFVVIFGIANILS